MKTKILTDALDELAPRSRALDWDNVGLLAGDYGREISKVYISLDASGEAVDSAVRDGCDMILTHHPLLFKPVKSLRSDDYIGRRLIKMTENHINYFAMHTNFDVSVMGKIAADTLGVRAEMPLEVTGEYEGEPFGIGFVGDLDLPVTLRELAAFVRNRFDLPPVRFFGDGDTLVSRIAVCPGSGKDMDGFALSAGAQVLLSGDIGHHYGIDCVEKGLCVIDAGHHGLEHIFVDYMKGWLAEHFPGLETVTDINLSPFQVV